MEKYLSRREFLTASAAAVSLGATGLSLVGCLPPGEGSAATGERDPQQAALPQRTLGKTGAKVTILGLGGAGFVSQSTDKEAVEKLMHEVLDAGVRYFDTAYSYGRSEEIIGNIMPEWRKKVILHTKVSTRDPNQWWAHFETSLKRLRVDYVDTLMIHHLGGPDDLAKLDVRVLHFQFSQEGLEGLDRRHGRGLVRSHNTHGDRRLAVSVVQAPLLTFGQGDPGDIRDTHIALLGLFDGQIADLLDLREFTSDLHEVFLFARVDHAGGCRDILPCQGEQDLVERDLFGTQTIALQINADLRLMAAKHIHVCNPRQSQNRIHDLVVREQTNV